MYRERDKQLAKFLVIHPNLDIYGGGERVCHHVIKSLLEHGEQVELLTFDFDPVRYVQIMGEKLPDGTVVRSLGKRVDVKPPFTVYKRRSRIIKLTKKIKDLEYDYAFSTQTMTAFESALFNEEKWNIAYVHFPEIHHRYMNSGRIRKVYYWLISSGGLTTTSASWTWFSATATTLKA